LLLFSKRRLLFFFEKKNQKTFVYLHRTAEASCDSGEKFFASFFQKRSAWLYSDVEGE